MKDKIIVTRYAGAYVSFALPTIGLPRIIEDMRVLRAALRETPQLSEFLTVPGVPLARKAAFLDKVFTGTLTSETMDFVKYLITKRRVELLDDIANYIRLTYSHGEAVNVVLQSAFPIDLEIAQRVKDALAQKMGRRMKLYFELDSALLGGIRIVFGNKVIDASIRSKLDEMKKQMLKAQVV